MTKLSYNISQLSNISSISDSLLNTYAAFGIGNKKWQDLEKIIFVVGNYGGKFGDLERKRFRFCLLQVCLEAKNLSYIEITVLGQMLKVSDDMLTICSSKMGYSLEVFNLWGINYASVLVRHQDWKVALCVNWLLSALLPPSVSIQDFAQKYLFKICYSDIPVF